MFFKKICQFATEIRIVAKTALPMATQFGQTQITRRAELLDEHGIDLNLSVKDRKIVIISPSVEFVRGAGSFQALSRSGNVGTGQRDGGRGRNRV